MIKTKNETEKFMRIKIDQNIFEGLTTLQKRLSKQIK